MSEEAASRESDSESESVSLPGSESSARVSEGGEHADDPPLLPPIAFVMPPRAVLVEGFASLDEFDFRTVFQRRAVVMRTVPILRGPFRNALRIAGKVQVHQNHFHQKNIFIKIHIHRKPLSSKTTLIKNQFHQKTNFIKKPLSSKTTFIKDHFHQKPLSSKTNFIKNQFHQNHFHQKPFSSEK